ncbi:hypothetical protein CPB86DRAFT_799132 [Serendipita vermifera]|nr:hypothetical protein CPB86DRAFT_799132 [Serendipita vermifera]
MDTEYFENKAGSLAAIQAVWGALIFLGVLLGFYRRRKHPRGKCKHLAIFYLAFWTCAFGLRTASLECPFVYCCRLLFSSVMDYWARFAQHNGNFYTILQHYGDSNIYGDPKVWPKGLLYSLYRSTTHPEYISMQFKLMIPPTNHQVNDLDQLAALVTTSVVLVWQWKAWKLDLYLIKKLLVLWASGAALFLCKKGDDSPIALEELENGGHPRLPEPMREHEIRPDSGELKRIPGNY